MKTVLIIPSSIHSHVLPTFGIAKVLKQDFKIHYAITSLHLKDLIETNGYDATMCSPFNLGANMESSYLKYFSKNINFVSILQCKLQNKVCKHREESIQRIIDKVKPSIVLIDIFISSDFIIIQKYKNIKIAFYNPMLSLQKDKEITKRKIFNEEYKPTLKNICKYVFSLIQNFYYYKFQLLIQMYQYKVSNDHKLDKNSYYTSYTNTPELILAPKELEMPNKTQTSLQKYLGTCIDESRISSNHKDIQEDIDKIIESNKQKRIIYCAFGTYYIGPNINLLMMLDKIITAIIKIPNTILIVAIKSNVIDAMKIHRKLPKNIFLFEYVNQVEMLRKTDVFITHGGLGSIKEGILRKTPMLVFPLDLRHDQKSNASRVEFHGIGLKGNFESETTGKIRKKLITLLECKSFKTKVISLSEKIQHKYNDSYIINTVRSIE